MYGSAEQDVMGSYKHSFMEKQKLFTVHTDTLRLKLLLYLLLLSLSLLLVIKIISLLLTMFGWVWRFYFRGTVSVPLDDLFYCISMYLVAFLCYFQVVCAIETECSLIYTKVQCHYQQLICWHIMSQPQHNVTDAKDGFTANNHLIQKILFSYRLERKQLHLRIFLTHVIAKPS